ncbi:glutaredoxin [Steroidobacter denitrificans]|uniref:Glutaredoxin n=1 Tax=Steroidobacter denitrificans TaxID=465721 RepID=A0A127FDL9_STEDE|nr:glutaredoxin 3 [Steroidobacter denitrificans]AMN48467.1 glutaredoxin [Steroidobacter denitrificans]
MSGRDASSLETAGSGPGIVMYTTGTCSYCWRARDLLEHKGAAFHEIRVDKDVEQREVMRQRSGRRTVPQIFIGEQHIGGYDDLAKLERTGKLDPLLAPYLKPA